jgi:hypothetical protein
MRGLEVAMTQQRDVSVPSDGARFPSLAGIMPSIHARHRNHSQMAFQLRRRFADPLLRCALVRADHIRKKRKADP